MQVFPISGWPQTKGKSSALTNKFLYGNFGEKYLSNGTGIFFFGPEKRIEMYHLQSPGTFFAVSSNPRMYGTENFSFFGKNEENGST